MGKIIVLSILISTFVLSYFMTKQHEGDDPFLF